MAVSVSVAVAVAVAASVVGVEDSCAPVPENDEEQLATLEQRRVQFPEAGQTCGSAFQQQLAVLGNAGGNVGSGVAAELEQGTGMLDGFAAVADLVALVVVVAVAVAVAAVLAAAVAASVVAKAVVSMEVPEMNGTTQYCSFECQGRHDSLAEPPPT